MLFRSVYGINAYELTRKKTHRPINSAGFLYLVCPNPNQRVSSDFATPTHAVRVLHVPKPFPANPNPVEASRT